MKRTSNKRGNTKTATNSCSSKSSAKGLDLACDESCVTLKNEGLELPSLTQSWRRWYQSKYSKIKQLSSCDYLDSGDGHVGAPVDDHKESAYIGEVPAHLSQRI
ncbi:hypothetical protein GJ496_009063 [Pomphorhynchus laevis]|nr:hypothetical protein GJ496_009063 [Pomphorhynchus laevis]